MLGRVAFTCRATQVDGAPTVLFIHGSLDDAAVWGGVIAALDHKVNTVTYDLPGFGSCRYGRRSGRGVAGIPCR